MGAKLQKNTHSVNFFVKKFAGFKKTPYLCTRVSKRLPNYLGIDAYDVNKGIDAYDVNIGIDVYHVNKGIDFVDCAPVAELVDALDLGSNVSRRAGSSPVRRTRLRVVLVKQTKKIENVGIAQLVRVSP